MSTHMNEEKFEEFLQREASSYNEPPARVPRDEMFAAIAAARGEQRGSRGPKIEDRRSKIRLAWIGMAATLAIGVAIGKYAFARHDEVPAALASVRGAPGSSGAATASAADSADRTYVLAATEQLGRAEALLTAYGASAPNAGVDAQLSGWARDILSNTRLLLDSPAAADPARRQLLEDLELVLVQMVQRSPAGGAAEERSHIDRSLERTQVLSRLRTALPGAFPAAHNNGI
jgi:hypothetical protein